MKDDMSGAAAAEQNSKVTNGDQSQQVVEHQTEAGKPVVGAGPSQEQMKGPAATGAPTGQPNELSSPGGMKRMNPQQQSPRPGPGGDRGAPAGVGPPHGNGMMRMPARVGIPSGGGPQQQQQQGGWGGPPPHNQYNNPHRTHHPMPRNYNNEMGAAYGSYTGRGNYNNQSMDALSKTNLYIRGLTPNTTDADLMNLCSQYGNIVSTKAIVDPMSGKCKGYGFVDFEHQGDAEKATQALTSAGIQAQMAKVSKQEQDPTNLYIANLPEYVDENYLEHMARPFGNVVSTRILRDNGGQSRGVGFCRMDTREMCEKIVHSLNKKVLPQSQEPLLIKFADSGNKKRQRDQFRSQQHLMAAAVGYDPVTGAAGGAGMQQHGPMGHQMIGQGNMNMTPRGYTMPGSNSQNQYMQGTAGAAAGNWGVNMYPQMAMSPVNPSTLPGTIDPNYLASQLSQMHLNQNQFNMQPQQGAAAQQGYGGVGGGPAQPYAAGPGAQQMAGAGPGGPPYDISTSPPQQLGVNEPANPDHFF